MAMMAATATAAADPLMDMLGDDEGGICYERVYDAAHLAKNPDQRTHSILMSLVKDPKSLSAIARLTFGDAEGVVHAIGECAWDARAALDDGKLIISTFRPGPGLNCLARASPAWASRDEVQEGGAFLVDMRDEKSMTIHTEGEIAAWLMLHRDNPAGFYPLGPDDRIFRVFRVASNKCGELVEQFRWDYN
ncbi:MAG: hypothetical protein KF849_07945 [Rhizobiaceae bacterium]|nr:hypothetical protein [Rhizobiaceae bacterium]